MVVAVRLGGGKVWILCLYYIIYIMTKETQLPTLTAMTTTPLGPHEFQTPQRRKTFETGSGAAVYTTGTVIYFHSFFERFLFENYT